MGGLGNQMFQYAFGKTWEIHLKQKIFYDKSWFYQDFVETNPRELKLEAFNISPIYTKFTKKISLSKIFYKKIFQKSF